MLKRTDPPTGSYVSTPPLTVEDLCRDLIGHDKPDGETRVRLRDVPLRYVGRESSGGSVHHLFEWGYGKWARIGREFLLYNGYPIEQGELVIAFGDAIAGIRLIPGENDFGTLLSVEMITISERHRLYLNAKKDRIIHSLSISFSGEIPQVDRILGFRGGDANRNDRFFAPNCARLTPPTEDAIKIWRKNHLKDGSKPLNTIVYARLMTQIFEHGGGLDLIYKGVSIGAEGRDGLARLEVGESIFVRAAEAKFERNDVVLAVEPTSSIGSVDCGDHGLEIRRRSFSFDEDALARIVEGKPLALSGRLLLVRVEDISGNVLALDHKRGAPTRDEKALEGLLARENGVLFCVFAGYERDASRRWGLIEIRPGALVRVYRPKDFFPEGLEEGDILRIERRGGRHSCVLAIYGDRRYSRVRRPVVVLPMNPLANELVPPFRSPDSLQRAIASFTAGDFRQLTAKLRTEISSQPRSPRVRVLERFMAQFHPKFAWLRADTGEEPSLRPDYEREILAGRLELIESDKGHAPRVQAMPLENANPELVKLKTDWRELTFADGSVDEIKERLDRVSWRYHDTKTWT